MEGHELETWQKLIKIMTHEIMNSIAPITSLSQTLSNFYIKDGNPVKLKDLQQKEIDNTIQGLAVIAERGEGLHSFVDDYRTLTKVPQAVFKPIEITYWPNSIRLLFESQVKGQGIGLKMENTYPNTTFLGDEKLLTQVVLNLLNNAAEAVKDAYDKTISIHIKQTPIGTLQLQVVDKGKGFKEEEGEALFLPFYTTKENGSGIGLSLSRQIMRLHKGRIYASSVKGEATVFSIEL